MTGAPTRPRAPGLSPLSTCSSETPGGAPSAVAMPTTYLPVSDTKLRFRNLNLPQASLSVARVAPNLRNQKFGAPTSTVAGRAIDHTRRCRPAGAPRWAAIFSRPAVTVNRAARGRGAVRSAQPVEFRKEVTGEKVDSHGYRARQHVHRPGAAGAGLGCPARC